MDLHRVTLPTFVLEPRSMLERITDFMAHPDILINVPLESDAEKRFIQTVKYFLSGWHIRPKGVKKPYNPVLGEFFRCKWKLNNESEAYYVAEQVSHHPPISAFHYHSPQNGVTVHGEFRPKSRFLGNSAATIMNGGSRISFDKYPDEIYTVSNPNVYVRGILFGTMCLELGDTSIMKCEHSDLVAEMEFTTKGFFSGVYNGIKGKIKNLSSGQVLYTLSGKWSDTIYIQKSGKNSVKEVLFDVSNSSICSKIVDPESSQENYESRKLWTKLTSALLCRNLTLATTEKTAIEDEQRKLRQERESAGQEYTSRFFYCENEEWKFIHEKDILAVKEPVNAAQKLSSVVFAKRT